MAPRKDLSSDMVNVRRAMFSFLIGSLLLVSVGAQAGAVESDMAAVAIAERGLALGLQAADEIQTDLEDGVLEGAQFASALQALETVATKLADKLAAGGFNGRGPERALQVHQALVQGDLPSEVKSESERIPGLAKAYGHLRAQMKGEGRGTGTVPPVTTP